MVRLFGLAILVGVVVTCLALWRWVRKREELRAQDERDEIFGRGGDRD